MKSDSRAVASFLSKVPPFSGLSPSEREALSRKMPLRKFSPKEVVFNEDEAASCSWIVYSGKARILIYYSGERLLQMELLGPGAIFGLFCRLGGARNVYPCMAVAAEEGLGALRLSDALFDKFCREKSSISRSICDLCAKRLGEVQKLVAFGREPAEHRVAKILLRAQQTFGARIPATRHDIAVQAGTVLETVFRALADFRRRGWIRTERGVIILKKPEALEAFAGRKRMTRPPRGAARTSSRAAP